MENTEQQIENLLLPYHADMTLLIQQLRVYIKKTTKPTIELVFDSYNSLNIGYGFTQKAWGCYCGIIVYTKHINLSFPSGAGLDDPENLLIGTGSRVRHIRIINLEGIQNPQITLLLKQARDIAFADAIGKLLSPKSNEILTVLKKSDKK